MSKQNQDFDQDFDQGVEENSEHGFESGQQQSIEADIESAEDILEEIIVQEQVIEAETAAAQHTLDEVADKVKALEDKLLRTHAEMDNVRRRAERDIASAHKFGSEKMIKGLLPVIDSLEKAQDHAFDNEEAKAIHEGVALTMKMFLDVLAKFGVECIDPLNAPFDPESHEAMSMVEHQEVDANTVVNVLQKGYRLNGRLVRPARVFVSK